MSKRDPQHRWAIGLEDSTSDRSSLWPRLAAAVVVILLIVAINVYLFSPDLQRRAEYAVRRLQTKLKALRPQDPYLPTPALPTIPTGTATAISTPASPTATPSPPLTTQTPPMPSATATVRPTSTPTPTSTPPPTPTPEPLPAAALLETECHEPQGWNNCGPATLAMALCYYGWGEDQYAVAQHTKPDKDDKNVSPSEMVAFVDSLQDTVAVLGYATDQQVLKLLLSRGFPVIVETWFIPEPDDEMGHYRLLTGYDDAAQHYVTQDSYNGADQRLSYAEMAEHWKVFNRVYVVVTEADRADDLRSLLPEEGGEEAMLRQALDHALTEIAADPEDRYAWFNAGTNYVGLGRLEKAAEAYDRARVLKLPYRLLWYQFGPFVAYLGTGRYQDVIDLANANLRAADNLEESYYYRALARRALGDRDGAREDLERALRLNPLFDRAAEALKE